MKSGLRMLGEVREADGKVLLHFFQDLRRRSVPRRGALEEEPEFFAEIPARKGFLPFLVFLHYPVDGNEGLEAPPAAAVAEGTGGVDDHVPQLPGRVSSPVDDLVFHEKGAPDSQGKIDVGTAVEVGNARIPEHLGYQGEFRFISRKNGKIEPGKGPLQVFRQVHIFPAQIGEMLQHIAPPFDHPGNGKAQGAEILFS